MLSRSPTRRGGAPLHRLATSRILHAAGDTAFILGAFYAAFLLRYGGELPAFNFESFELAAPWIALGGVVLLAAYDLYDQEPRDWSEQLPSIVIASLMHMVAAVAISFFVRGFSFPRTVFLIAAPLEVLALSTWRYAIYRAGAALQGLQRTLVLTAGEDPRHLVDRLREVQRSTEVRTVTDRTGITFALTSLQPHLLYIDGTMPVDLRRDAVHLGLVARARVYVVPDLYDILLTKSRMVTVGDVPVLAVHGLHLTTWALFMKRVLDLLLAILGLTLALPVMLLVSAAIALMDGLPVLYTQERLTEGGRTFRLLKFRTMCTDAEAQTGPVLSSGETDPRVTPLGRFLRAARLDELPQLFNVLIGDMSLVGPRPERPFFVSQFQDRIPEYAYRFEAKAGLTGLAQVEGRYSTAVEDKTRFDLLYFRHHSPLLDLHILLKTLRAVFIRRKSS